MEVNEALNFDRASKGMRLDIPALAQPMRFEPGDETGSEVLIPYTGSRQGLARFNSKLMVLIDAFDRALHLST